MTINNSKTKVVHFRNITVPVTKHAFKIGGSDITVESKYKYLGLYLDQHLDMSVTVNYVAKAAQRALGLLIAKDKCHGGMPIEIFTKLYDTLVQSVINYGAMVWGQTSYSVINNVQNRAARYFLGVHKRAPNAMVNGDIGWTAPSARLWACVSNHWARLVNMDRSRITYKVFRWSYNLALRNNKNWCYRAIKQFNKLEINSNIDGDDVSKNVIKRTISKRIQEQVCEQWVMDLNRNAAKQGEGGNKLRLYRTFKHDYHLEPYVEANLSRQQRSSLAKFRAGIAPINIEIGRFRGLPVAERVCPRCPQSVEDELHVLLHCPCYSDIRKDMFNDIKCLMGGDVVENLNETEKLGLILSDKKIVKVSARACKLILEKRRSLIT